MRSWWVLSSAAALSLAACGDDGGPADAGADAAVVDAGSAVDAGPAPDAGPRRDSGPPVDAGVDAGPREGACGDGRIQEPEVCDDDNTDDGDGCSGDCLSDETCGNGVTDAVTGEACDDGDTVGGDGCSADCLSDETCGNGVVDVGVGEVCDDGNTEDGDGCAGDCSSELACGDGVVDAGEVCDDGNTEDGDGCSGDCLSDETCGNGVRDAVTGEVCDDGGVDDGDGCSADCLSDETCGNGVIDPGEDCDDADSIDGDGCDNDCRFSCEATADCRPDGDRCNGRERCDVDAHVCFRTAPPAEGTACRAGRVCRDEVCVSPDCGDGVVDPDEECDDMNAVDGDGCDRDCTFSCETDADCDDGEPCDGAERCDPGTHRCEPGPVPGDGAPCDVDEDPATRDLCVAEVCRQSRCGDGYTDRGRGEECDDGGRVDGDGCEGDCTLRTSAAPPTAFRVTEMALVDPHVYTRLIGCSDVTGIATSELQGALDAYALNLVEVFRPLDIVAPTNPFDFYADATCAAGGCSPGASPAQRSAATNRRSATAVCFEADPATLNPRYEVPNAPNGPCYVADAGTVTLSLAGADVGLRDSTIAATWAGGAPPTRQLNGVVAGFLTLADARATTVPLPAFLGGDTTLFDLLAGGGSCESREDDRDDLDGDGVPDGWWFYVDFRAERLDWSEP